MFESGTELLVEALPSVWDGSCEAILAPQVDGDATKAAKVQKEEAELDLDAISAAQAHNRVRAFSGWPSTWAWLQAGVAAPVKAKLLRTRLVRASSLEHETRPRTTRDAQHMGGRADPVPPAHLSDAAVPVPLAQAPDVEAPPGRELRLSKDGKALQLACGDGSVLELLEVTLPGKKPVGAKAYWNGCKDGGSRWLTSADAEAALAPASDAA